MDQFLAQFQSLAQEAGYDWNAQPTLTLLASKLPVGMLHHLYKVTRSQNFQDWINGIRQFHQDNIAVNNIRNITEGSGGRSKGGDKTGFSKKARWTTQELAKLLNVKLPSRDPNAMDTRADRVKSKYKRDGAKARLSQTVEDEQEKKKANEDRYRSGQCFNCGLKGHITKNCPKRKKTKPYTKARQAQTEDSGEDASEEDVSETSDDEKADNSAFIKKIAAMGTQKKINLLNEMAIANGDTKFPKIQDF